MLNDLDFRFYASSRAESEHRDLDTVIARLSSGPTDRSICSGSRRQADAQGRDRWLEARLIPDRSRELRVD